MRTLLRILLVLVLLIVIVVVGATGYAVYTVRRPLPQTSGTLKLAGLDAPVTIYRDAQGVPQIYATTTHDLFFAEGVVHAQDRWWQMEFNRHIGQGRVSELVGKNADALSSDKFIRTLGWNRAAQADYAAAPSDTRAVLDAYAAGVNAYIGGKSGPDLAVEYSLLAVNGVHIPIQPWTPPDTLGFGIAQAWSLSGNMGDEMARVALYKSLGTGAKDIVDNYLYPPYAYDKQPTILNASDLPTQLGTIAQPEPSTSTPVMDWQSVQTSLIGGVSPDFSPIFGKKGVGSNDWVVSGKLTQSGKPLLANDPHIDIQMPAIWYQLGLHCVQVSDACPYDVEGFSFPATPGIVIGHNQRIAWGVTNVGPDTQDLYTIKLDPSDSTKYMLDGQSTPIQTIHETIKFGDSTPSLDLAVRVTHFGPIITDASSTSTTEPMALRWAALDKPSDLQGSVLAIDRATDWTSFRQALTRWSSPSQNFVYADVDGNIGYQTPGLIPIRPHGLDGLMPTDGSTTQSDWKGYVPFEDLPSVFNPSRGYIATANNAVVPDAYYDWLAKQLGGQFGADSNYTFARDWEVGYRAQRITSLITANNKQTPETFQAIQGDITDLSVPDILPTVLAIDYGNAIPSAVIDWMKSWKGDARADSGQPALYESFLGHLSASVWQKRLGYTPSDTPTIMGLSRLIAVPDNALWNGDGAAGNLNGRDAVLKDAFVAAYQELIGKLGADYTKWQWGTLHQATFVSNPLGKSGIGPIESFVNMGPIPLGGTGATIDVSHWDFNSTYNVTGTIPSMRMIIDLSNFGNSRWIIPTGQSGHPTSDHYRDLNTQWSQIQYNPMPWDKNAITSAAAATLTLQPS